MSRIGFEVGRLRQERKLTRKQLGKLIGVSEGFIEEVESGKKVMNDELLTRVSKALGQDVSGFGMLPDEPAHEEEKTAKRSPEKPVPGPVQQIWSDALGGVLKTIPVHSYKMDAAIGNRQLPVISNKVEGMPKDKVFYLKIEDADMTGFRIFKDDFALVWAVQEVDKDGIYFIEHEGLRAVRQVKRLGGEKVLLVSNKGGISTETASLRSIKVLGRLVRLEIAL